MLTLKDQVLLIKDPAFRVLAKETVYPEGSIVKRKLQAYAVNDKDIRDWARVWFWDGTVKEYDWTPPLFSPEDFWDNDIGVTLPAELIDNLGYVVVREHRLEE